MAIIPSSGPNPWRKPPEHRRLVTVSHETPGTYELTILPGAGADELAQAAAALPDAVYTDGRSPAPAEPATPGSTVLVFRAVPDEPDAVAARPSPRRGAPGQLSELIA